jgi:hypothetical protein
MANVHQIDADLPGFVVPDFLGFSGCGNGLSRSARMWIDPGWGDEYDQITPGQAKVVQELLGHSTSTLTRDTYTSVSPRLARERTAALVPRTAGSRSAAGLMVPLRSPRPENDDGRLFPREERPAQDGCAARDSNPEPAD